MRFAIAGVCARCYQWLEDPENEACFCENCIVEALEELVGESEKAAEAEAVAR